MVVSAFTAATAHLLAFFLPWRGGLGCASWQKAHSPPRLQSPCVWKWHGVQRPCSCNARRSSESGRVDEEVPDRLKLPLALPLLPLPLPQLPSPRVALSSRRVSGCAPLADGPSPEAGGLPRAAAASAPPPRAAGGGLLGTRAGVDCAGAAPPAPRIRCSSR